jgi:catechol 2,3-dioxygenase-like lactoylglutathione lyase family enzyme
MQIRHVNINVGDQQKALSFYTSVVGFVKKLDVPIGEVRWLTVSSPEGAEDVELVLEPNNFVWGGLPLSGILTAIDPSVVPPNLIRKSDTCD